MRLLVISDLHGRQDVLDALDEPFKAADAVVFAGDFARFGHEETGLPALTSLCAKHGTIFSVIGNCDPPSFLAEVQRRGISVEGEIKQWQGLRFAGSGGGSKFTGTTPNEKTEQELAADFECLSGAAAGKGGDLILIMHNPPKDSACDVVSSGAHVGSSCFKDLIEKLEPLLVVTGHIHESAAICQVGKTLVMNPGALLEGKYGQVELVRKGDLWQVVKAELCSFCSL